MKTKSKKGFTLIELIVVMAVIGVLVLLAIPKFMGYTEKARFTRLINNSTELEKASERYYMDKGDWPRLSDAPYTAEDIEGFAQKIYDSTGKIITLDAEGKYYDISYEKLSKYISIPDNKEQYIIQNPIGNIYSLEGLSKEAKTRLDTKTPSEPEEILTPVHIQAGWYQSRIFLNDNTLRVWGLNSNGQLGLSDVENRLLPTELNIDNVEEVVSGALFSMYIKNDGTVWASGLNNKGQLGLGDTINRNVPTKVNITNVKEIELGNGHTIILKNDGTVWAAGNNEYGQLGGLGGSYVTSLAKISITDVKDVEAFGHHTLFLKNDGTVWSCGYNYYGELGLGSTYNIGTPTKINISSVKQIETGDNFSVLLKEDGTVWTFGRNNSGRLGITGTDYDVKTPKQVAISNVKELIVGGYHTLAVKEDGSIWGWGMNSYGQLGLGDTTDRNAPVKLQLHMNEIKEIETGIFHTMILKNDNTVWIWGSSNYGQLGLGDKVNKLIPTQLFIE